MNKAMFILLFAGLLFLTVAGIEFYQERNFIASSTLTVGKVKDYAKQEDMQQKILCYPVIAFEDEQGRSHRFISDVSLFSIYYPLGKPVEVYYHPMFPKQAKVKLFISQWGDITGSFLIGTLLLLYSGSTFIHWVGRYIPTKEQENLRKYKERIVETHTT